MPRIMAMVIMTAIKMTTMITKNNENKSPHNNYTNSNDNSIALTVIRRGRKQKPLKRGSRKKKSRSFHKIGFKESRATIRTKIF